MNLRNLLKTGDYVMPLPVGIYLTIQYNTSGNIERVYVNTENKQIEYTDKFFPIMLERQIVPTHIQIKGKPSHVKGVLYTGKLYRVSGELPSNSESRLLKDFLNNPTSFNFFAYAINNDNISFGSISGLRQFAGLNKFNMLPGWAVPPQVSDNLLNSWVNSPQYTFSEALAGLVIYRDNSYMVEPMHMTMSIIKATTKYTDINGFVKLKVEFTDSDLPTRFFDYSDAVTYNIQPGSCLITTEIGEVWRCLPSAKNYTRDNIITCEYCGRRYAVPDTGLVSCTDTHCPSKLVSNILQFIGVLDLPIYDNIVINSWLKSHKVTCIPDLFLLDEYKDSICRITIGKLLRALIPMTFIRAEDVMTEFGLACSNKEQTIRYYLDNPDKITADLTIISSDLSKLVSWLSDDCNHSDLLTIINSTQIELIESTKKFNGAPIFRGKTIFITGNFIHGGIGDVADILQSYSATVTAYCSNKVDCVITGGTHENIDGKAVRAAVGFGIPVIDEVEFFRKYDIDADLASCSAL